MQPLFDRLAERDAKAARRARSAIAKGIEFLRTFPFSCRKVSPEHPWLRELTISFGATGCVALFEVEDSQTVAVLAIRHQREEDVFCTGRRGHVLTCHICACAQSVVTG